MDGRAICPSIATAAGPDGGGGNSRGSGSVACGSGTPTVSAMTCTRRRPNARTTRSRVIPTRGLASSPPRTWRTFDIRGCRLVRALGQRDGPRPPDRRRGRVRVPRAFHLAGVENVLSSLWKVEDAIAGEHRNDDRREIKSGQRHRCDQRYFDPAQMFCADFQHAFDHHGAGGEQHRIDRGEVVTLAVHREQHAIAMRDAMPRNRNGAKRFANSSAARPMIQTGVASRRPTTSVAERIRRTATPRHGLRRGSRASVAGTASR